MSKCPNPECGSTRTSCYHQSGSFREYQCLKCRAEFETHEVHAGYLRELVSRSLALAALEAKLNVPEVCR